jgi:hypothetical protein
MTVAVAGEAELDLPGLQVPSERDQPKGDGRKLDHAHRSVPRAWHAYQVLVADPHRVFLSFDLAEGGHLRGSDSVELGGHKLKELLRREVGIANDDSVSTPEQRPHAVVRMLGVRQIGLGRKRRRTVLGLRALNLAAVHRRRPPHVPVGGEVDAEGPARNDSQAA